MKTIR